MLWTGTVYVDGTIVVGTGTTVRIVGNGVAGTNNSDDTIGTTSADGIASVAVNTTSLQPGPIFFVQGGQLFLERLALRGGNANGGANLLGDNPSSSSSADIAVNGGGVHAVDANVTVVGCEFRDNFAQHWGGGIFANRSNLVVEASLFQGCSAGSMPSPGDEDVEGAGGGIGVR